MECGADTWALACLVLLVLIPVQGLIWLGIRRENQYRKWQLEDALDTLGVLGRAKQRVRWL